MLHRLETTTSSIGEKCPIICNKILAREQSEESFSESGTSGSDFAEDYAKNKSESSSDSESDSVPSYKSFSKRSEKKNKVLEDKTDTSVVGVNSNRECDLPRTSKYTHKDRMYTECSNSNQVNNSLKPYKCTRKKNCCIYCKKLFINLARHLIQVHGNEDDVKKLSLLPRLRTGVSYTGRLCHRNLDPKRYCRSLENSVGFSSVLECRT